jgi:hypothetical protein
MGPTQPKQQKQMGCLEAKQFIPVQFGRDHRVFGSSSGGGKTKVRMSDFTAFAPLARRRCETPSLEKAVWRGKRGKRIENRF